MKKRATKNSAASVRDRLLQRAKSEQEDFQFVLTRYGIERLMFRLSQSAYAANFVLKGAMLFLAWTGTQYRATKDMDLLALKSSSVDELRRLFRELCQMPLVEDGLMFQPGSVCAEEIREDNLYEGVRVKLVAFLGQARVPVQVDIGFGDAVTPKPAAADFPTLLNHPAPHLAMYPRDTVLAEKYEAMVKLGLANSRMKDLYDIWALSQQFEFEGVTLSRAIKATFKRRKTELTESLPVVLTREAASDPVRQRRWRAFVDRSRLRFAVAGLEEVMGGIRRFIEKPVIAASKGRLLHARWAKGGPWRKS